MLALDYYYINKYTMATTPEGSSQQDTTVYEYKPALPGSAQEIQDRRDKMRAGIISPESIAVSTHDRIEFKKVGPVAPTDAKQKGLTANPKFWSGFHGPIAGKPVDENNPDDRRIPE